jgi:predicted helicase
MGMLEVGLRAFCRILLRSFMERLGVKADKDSGIVNDANVYANETTNDPRYPFDLFRRVITVSLETMKIVRGLPKLDI